MSKRSKACDIKPKVRNQVLERDSKRCVVCSTTYNLELAHVLSRAHGGLGKPKNLVTLCQKHHKMLDSGKYKDQVYIKNIITDYMFKLYGAVLIEDIKYSKWGIK